MKYVKFSFVRYRYQNLNKRIRNIFVYLITSILFAECFNIYYLISAVRSFVDRFLLLPDRGIVCTHELAFVLKCVPARWYFKFC